MISSTAPSLHRFGVESRLAAQPEPEDGPVAHDAAPPPSATPSPASSGPADLARAFAHLPCPPRPVGPPASSPRAAAPADAANGQTQALFKEQFTRLAVDRRAFDATMQQVFGTAYDRGRAEQFRQRALAGDFAWLPPVKMVDAHTLGGANGAYDAAAGVVYINRELAAADPAKAAQTFVEEAGHHLDATLNTADTRGDEGEMFRRVLGGEALSAQQLAEIRDEDDKGTITVDGRQVEVEFWNPLKSIKKGVTSVANGLVSSVKDVGKAVVGSAKDVARGAVSMTWGVASNLAKGRVGEALDSVVRGVDQALFRSTQRLASGVLDSVQSMTNGLTDAVGVLGKPVRWVSDRVFDIGHTAIDTGCGIVRDSFRMLPDQVNGFFGDVEHSVRLAIDGQWGNAFKHLGKAAFVNVPARIAGGTFDMTARFLQGSASATLTAIGLEAPARRPTDAERDYLRTIYGDSIDYDVIRIKNGGPLNNAMTAHAVGDTVYLPSSYFDASGALTADGLETLGHEVGHVWQNQNGGGDYIHDALSAQLWSWASGGDRNGAYDWRGALADGASFSTMNAEQQASVMEAIGIALANDQQITASDGRGSNYTSAELAFLKRAAADVRRGEGAG